jgi:hypothetical protein
MAEAAGNDDLTLRKSFFAGMCRGAPLSLVLWMLLLLGALFLAGVL